MHRRFNVCLSFLIGLAPATLSAADPMLIPTPTSLVSGAGEFEVTPEVRLVVGRGAERAATVLTQQWRLEGSRGARILELRLKRRTTGSTDESYELQVTPERVSLAAPDERGLFYAAQTLLQLASGDCRSRCAIPSVHILDAPRFAWRGLLIDVSRHFFDKDVLKRVLDQMAVYKLNVLHLHLTDDTGWRVEIPAYPELTEIGARGDAESYGTGPARFFTAADIEELVAYAAERHIDIVPEIELPGHSGAAARSYPELFDGEGTINPGHPDALPFVRAVFTEVARLFPSKYIHFGGDEVSDGRWDRLKEVVALKQRLGFTSTRQVESYFDGEVAKIIVSLGRRPMAWDEVAAAGVGNEVMIQWWRKDQPQVRDAAVRAGHDVVLSPVDFTYFDYPQGLGEPGAPWEGNDGGPTSVDKLLSWRPVPEGYGAIEVERVRGVEAALWTEFVRSERYLNYMLYPRLLALAEIAWSTEPVRDPAVFHSRLPRHFERLESLGIHARRGYDDATEFRIH